MSSRNPTSPSISRTARLAPSRSVSTATADADHGDANSLAAVRMPNRDGFISRLPIVRGVFSGAGRMPIVPPLGVELLCRRPGQII